MERQFALSAEGVKAYNLVASASRNSKKLRGKERQLVMRANRKLAAEFHKLVMRDLKSRRAINILEIGCGGGEMLVKLAKATAFRNSYLLGIDKEAKEVRIASMRARKAGLSGKVHFSVGRNNKIPSHEKFDLVFTVLSFHEWRHGYRSIPYILSKLSKRGRFVIYETMPINLKNFRNYNRRRVKVIIRGTHELAKVAFYCD